MCLIRNTFLGLMVVFSCCAWVCGFSSPAFAGNERVVAFVMKALNNPFWLKVDRAAREYAKENDIQLELFGVEREADASSQIDIIENLISRDYGAIIIAPNDSKQLVPITKKALAHGTKVVIVDNALDAEHLGSEGAAIPFIGSDNFAGAKMLGEYMRTRLGGNGRVIIIEGMPGVSNSDKRKHGFMEGLGKGSGIEIVGIGRGNWHMDEAFSATVRLLENDNNIDAVFCTNDVMAMGAIQALEMYNLAGKVLVAGYDNIDLAKIAMQTGYMHATVDQHAEFMGRYSVEIALKAMNNRETDQVRHIPLELVTVEHVGKRIFISLPEEESDKGNIFLRDLRKQADILGMEVIFYPGMSTTEGGNLQELEKRLHGVDLLLTALEDDPMKELALERNVPVVKIDYAGTGDAGKVAAKAAAIYFRKP